MKHNNVLPNGHFHKQWQTRVKTWLDQAGRKRSRRAARAIKAAKVAPRPLDGLLRPAVRCPTFKYNTKLRAGRGFTLEEIKAAGIRRKEARSIGIAVDHRRQNHSEESLLLNVERLKAYKSKLVVFPRKAKKPKHGDTTDASLLAAAKALPRGKLLPVTTPREVVLPSRAITAEEKSFEAFKTLRQARSEARYAGIRAKRAADKAAAEAEKKK